MHVTESYVCRSAPRHAVRLGAAPIAAVIPGELVEPTMTTGAPASLGTDAWRARFRLARPRRILLLLIGVWIVQVFDLGFTLFAHRTGTLSELNPIGEWALQRGAPVVIAFKATLLLGGTVVLWRYRREYLSEALLWFVAGVCVALSVRWHQCIKIVADNWEDIQYMHVNNTVPARLPYAPRRDAEPADGSAVALDDETIDTGASETPAAVAEPVPRAAVELARRAVAVDVSTITAPVPATSPPRGLPWGRAVGAVFE